MTSTQDLTDRPAAHVAAAVIAVMQHLIDHGLSAPLDVVPARHAVRVFAPTGTYDAWRDSVTVDEESCEDLAAGLHGIGPCVRWESTGRLPDSGVRIEIC